MDENTTPTTPQSVPVSAGQTIQIQCVPPPPRRRSLIGRLMRGLFVLIFLVSILLNVYLALLLAVSLQPPLEAKTLEEGAADQVVAVYAVEGMIGDKAAALFDTFYRLVRDDDNIRAVVVRVNSTGGAAAASDRIHHMVQSIRQNLKRPVVVSMGGYALSGGYYIAAGADEIYAEPNTLTGSIGVIAIWPVIKDFTEKHGLQVVTIRSTPAQRWKAKEYNPFESPEPRIRRQIQGALDYVHARFEQVVRDGRGKKLQTKEAQVTVNGEDGKETTYTETEPLNGRSYVAGRAEELGLIDKVGYLHDAAAGAAKLAGLTKPKVVQYAERKGLMERMFGHRTSLIDAKVIDRLTAPRIMLLWSAE
jgi:protease-4